MLVFVKTYGVLLLGVSSSLLNLLFGSFSGEIIRILIFCQEYLIVIKNNTCQQDVAGRHHPIYNLTS